MYYLTHEHKTALKESGLAWALTYTEIFLDRFPQLPGKQSCVYGDFLTNDFGCTLRVRVGLWLSGDTKFPP